MEDLEQLERFSLVNKIVNELNNHTGLSDKVLGTLSVSILMLHVGSRSITC